MSFVQSGKLQPIIYINLVKYDVEGVLTVCLLGEGGGNVGEAFVI